MKYVSIAAKFKDPAKALKGELLDSGARNVNLHPTCDGWFSVGYEIKLADPQKEIIRLVEKSGAKLLRLVINVDGADFDFRVDDQIDEHAFKQQMINQLKSAGYRAN